MSDRFDQLYEKYSDGTLDSAERQEFLKLLGQQAMRTRLFSHATFEAVIGEELRQSDEEADTATSRQSDRITKLPVKGSRSRRIDKRTSPRKKTSRWFGAGVALAACAVLAVVAFLFVSRNQSRIVATITSGDGDFEISRGNKTVKIAINDPVYENDQLVTKQGSVTLSYPSEKTTITLEKDSALTLEKAEGGKVLTLSRGRILADVAPQQSKMMLHTPFGTAEVLGTQFRLSAQKDSTELHVIQGRVKLTDSADKQVIVEDGQVAFGAKEGVSAAYAYDAGESIRAASYAASLISDEGSLVANARVLKESGADIIGIQKIDSRDNASANPAQKLAAQLGEWHYAFFAYETTQNIPEGKVFVDQPLAANQKGSGVAILSRYPIVSADAKVFYFNPPESERWKQKRGIVHAKIRLPSGRDIDFFSAYTSINSQEHTVHCKEIVEFSKKFSDPQIVTGIIHVQTDSPAFAPLAERFSDAWKAAGKGPGLTLPAPEPLYRSDFILFRGGLNAKDARVGSAGNSDHHSVIVNFVYPFAK